jgi:hypothetical protein
VAGLPSSNKNLGDHPGAKMEQKGGQSAAIHKGGTASYTVVVPCFTPPPARSLLASIARTDDGRLWPPQTTPSGSHAQEPHGPLQNLPLYETQSLKEARGG